MNVVLNIIFSIFSFFWFVIFFYIFISFIFKMLIPLVFWGAFYVQSQDNQVEKMIEFAEIKSQEKAVDLGAGDGKIVIALAKKGIEAHGYEINPILVWKARQKINKARLNKKAFMHWGNLWGKNISDFDIIIIYGISFAMEKLEKKFKKEAKKNARIICNQFCFPTWLPIKKDKKVYLYKK